MSKATQKENRWSIYQKKLQINGSLILLTLSYITLIIGIWITGMLGYHAFDSCQNYIFLRDSATIDAVRLDPNYSPPDYYETTLDGDQMTFEQCYVFGLNYLWLGIPIAIAGGILVGYSTRTMVR